jgi:fumarate reductase (CoM/CoB) subunit B
MLLAKGISKGMDVDESMIDSISTCTTCGLCEQMCPAGAKPPDVFEELRRDLVRMGKVTGSQLELYNNTLLTGNPLGEKRSGTSWILDQRDVPKVADYVYFVGCLGSYRFREDSLKTYDLIKDMGVTVLSDEVCCGSPLLRTGFDADELIRHNLEQIEKTGAHTLIASCAGCYNTFKNDYPDRFNVVHITEFLAEHMDELGLVRLDLTVTYHDPCHLGRTNRIFDAPRKLIMAVCDLKEMRTNRENARCCGGGGGVRKGYPDLSASIAKKRIMDVPDGVGHIVTCCPLCRTNLEQASDVPVIDLLDLLDMAQKEGLKGV